MDVLGQDQLLNGRRGSDVFELEELFESRVEIITGEVGDFCWSVTLRSLKVLFSIDFACFLAREENDIFWLKLKRDIAENFERS